MDRKGLFITFEGSDGCGKTTQIELCFDYLKKQGFDVVLTREPGALELGKKIREILLHHKGEISKNAEMFLFLADRANHIDTFIRPAIEKGMIVLCDRHTDSTLAYQGYGRGNDLTQIKELNSIATNGITPDLTLVFDVDLDVAQSRVGKEKDRMESIGLDFHKKVKDGYLKIASKEPKRVKLVDANLPVEDVFEQVKITISNLLV